MQAIPYPLSPIPYPFRRLLRNPPPLFPFLPIPYPLPLSTPATQAKLTNTTLKLDKQFTTGVAPLFLLGYSKVDFLVISNV